MAPLTLAPRHLPVLLILVCALLLTSASHTSADACASCLNGGKLLMPNNIFGFCRCKCPDMFRGPRCQFNTRKRTSLSPLSMGWGGQLYEDNVAAGQAGDGDDDVMMRVEDEAMLKLILQQLYAAQQLPGYEDRRRR
jgi:hypothetical protein